MDKNRSVTDKTLEYWEKKANCARASVCGVLSYNNKESLCDPFYKAMLPMGGGFGEGLVCGAVTGSLAALSLVLAEKGLKDEEIANILKLMILGFGLLLETRKHFDYRQNIITYLNDVKEKLFAEGHFQRISGNEKGKMK